MYIFYHVSNSCQSYTPTTDLYANLQFSSDLLLTMLNKNNTQSGWSKLSHPCSIVAVTFHWLYKCLLYIITDQWQCIYLFLVPDSCCPTVKNVNKNELHRRHQQIKPRLIPGFALVGNIGSPSSLVIFQHRVYNLYVISEHVSCGVIFWPDLSRWPKN